MLNLKRLLTKILTWISTHSAVYDYGTIAIGGDLASIESWIKTNFVYGKWTYARVNPTSSGYFGTSSFSIMANCTSANYGWGFLITDNEANIVFFRVVNGTFYYRDVPAIHRKTGPNGWLEWEKYQDGRLVIDGRFINLSLTHYNTAGGFYAYMYTADWASNGAPYFASADYEITFQPVIGSGFSIPATVMGRSTGSCRMYMLGTSSGTQNVELNFHIVGRWK